MKAPDFAYARPASLTEVFDLLDGGDGVSLLAGGQSLLASLNMRLSAPSLLVDINHVPDLFGVSLSGDTIRIGAMTRHHELATSPLIAQHLPLLALAGPHIAHPAIRNRGTIGGSLALADPATEWPACCLALDATMVVANRAGERRIAAADFFTGVYETALKPGDVLVAIEIPLPPGDALAGFDELARRHGDYAIVGLAAQGRRSESGWSELKLAFCGTGDRPILAVEAADALIAGKGMPAAQSALDAALSPFSDGECAAGTKMHLARVLLGRVVGAMEAGRLP